MLKSFDEFNKLIFKSYEENDLKYLYDIKIDGKHSSEFLSDILRRKQSQNPVLPLDFKIHDEFNFISKDIKYITSALFLLRPYINDVNKTQGEYHQTLADSRYLMYATFGIQSVYNFWDRIGDLLYLYFYTGLKPENVYLGRVLNNIQPHFKQFQEYIDLNNLYENELKDILDKRNDAVHNFQLECKYYWGNIENYHNHEERKKLNSEKLELPEKMKNYLELCLKGFELALRFIDILPDTMIKFIYKRKFVPNSIHFNIVKLKLDKTDITDRFDLAKTYLDEDDLKSDISQEMKIARHRIDLEETIV